MCHVKMVLNVDGRSCDTIGHAYLHHVTWLDVHNRIYVSYDMHCAYTGQAVHYVW